MLQRYILVPSQTLLELKDKYFVGMKMESGALRRIKTRRSALRVKWTSTLSLSRWDMGTFGSIHQGDNVSNDKKWSTWRWGLERRIKVGGKNAEHPSARISILQRHHTFACFFCGPSESRSLNGYLELLICAQYAFTDKNKPTTWPKSFESGCLNTHQLGKPWRSGKMAKCSLGQAMKW